MYADKITKAMKTTIDETARRREKQVEYNTEHGVTPTTVYKTVDEIMQATAVADVRGRYKTKGETNNFEMPDEFSALELIDRLEKEMKTAAASLEFEKAAQIRDEILKLKGKIGK